MRTSIVITAILCMGILSSCSDRDEKPNIIFILTDDQRWDALGFAGNPIIQTPHMDELARSGLYFQNAFVTSPICAASRASLFTGLYERTHNYTFGKPPLDNSYMAQCYPYFVEMEGKKVHLADVHGQHAIDFIKSNKEQSFCLSLSFWSPHANDDEAEQYFWPASCDSLYTDITG